MQGGHRAGQAPVKRGRRVRAQGPGSQKVYGQASHRTPLPKPFGRVHLTQINTDTGAGRGWHALSLGSGRAGHTQGQQRE